MIDLKTAPFNAFRATLQSLTPFTNQQLDMLGEGLEIRNYDRKQFLHERGKTAHTMGYLLSGSVRYFYEKEGLEITNYFSLENDWVGSYHSFLRETPSRVNVQALEDSQILMISRDQLARWEANPEFALKVSELFRRLAEHLLNCYEDRVVSFVLDSPEERYLNLLQDNPDILQRIPQQYIANFLGITPVSLSRLRRRVLQ